MKNKIVIVGGGPAGMAAALAAKEHCKDKCNVIIIEREHTLGGILNQCIHDGFGLLKFGQMMTGPEYANKYEKLIEKADIKVYTDTMVIDVTNDKKVTFINKNGLSTIKASSIIFATGCRERTRGNIAIPGTRPAGIFTAGVAQNLTNNKNICIGKKVIILGSGDIGLIMARRLTYEGADVIGVIELQKQPGGLQRNISQCLYDFDIPLYLQHTIVEIKGKERLQAVTVAPVDELGNPIENNKFTLECDTLVLSVGLIPENEIAKKSGVLLDDKTNGALTDEYLQTNISGVFVCGNSIKVMDLVDYVSEQGEVAGYNAVAYLFNEKMYEFKKQRSLEMPKGLPENGKFTCILCPNGCSITVEGNNVNGNKCNRGKQFAIQEKKTPKRVLTITILTQKGYTISAKTDRPIDKEIIKEVIKICKKIRASDNCKIGDVILDNIANTNANLIATSKVHL